MKPNSKVSLQRRIALCKGLHADIIAGKRIIKNDLIGHYQVGHRVLEALESLGVIQTLDQIRGEGHKILWIDPALIGRSFTDEYAATVADNMMKWEQTRAEKIKSGELIIPTRQKRGKVKVEYNSTSLTIEVDESEIQDLIELYEAKRQKAIQEVIAAQEVVKEIDAKLDKFKSRVYKSSVE